MVSPDGSESDGTDQEERIACRTDTGNVSQDDSLCDPDQVDSIIESSLISAVCPVCDHMLKTVSVGIDFFKSWTSHTHRGAIKAFKIHQAQAHPLKPLWNTITYQMCEDNGISGRGAVTPLASILNLFEVALKHAMYNQPLTTSDKVNDWSTVKCIISSRLGMSIMHLTKNDLRIYFKNKTEFIGCPQIKQSNHPLKEEKDKVKEQRVKWMTDMTVRYVKLVQVNVYTAEASEAWTNAPTSKKTNLLNLYFWKVSLFLKDSSKIFKTNIAPKPDEVPEIDIQDVRKTKRSQK